MKSFLLVIAPILIQCSPDSIGSCAEGDCKSKTGVFEYDNGDVYYGQFSGSYRHGEGIQSYNTTGLPTSTPTKYDGEWQIDLYDGKGRLELLDGTIQKGLFKANQLHGAARIQYANKSFIEGNFAAGKANGRCAFMDVDVEQSSYIGDWLEGIWHGEGIYEKENGFKHNGTFVLGRMNGHAKRRYADGSSYEGNFMDGKRSGFGTYRVELENKKWWKYQGQFENDEMVGEGTMTRSNGSQKKEDWYTKSGNRDDWKELADPNGNKWKWEEETEEDEKKEEINPVMNDNGPPEEEEEMVEPMEM